ncbi:MAG: hypothetical protein FJ134_07900 [Deltaproteobacteria bacterium]|nr:hypothetical protein [Deltaproteobacteria bacterium]
MAVLEGASRAKPLMLDKNLPFNAWGDGYVQFGRVFRKFDLQLKDPNAPVIPQPEMLDRRKPRQEIIWKKKQYYVQDGWLFERHTWKAVKI